MALISFVLGLLSIADIFSASLFFPKFLNVWFYILCIGPTGLILGSIAQVKAVKIDKIAIVGILLNIIPTLLIFLAHGFSR